MRLANTPLILPHQTPVFVVDPLKDFTHKDGVFAQAYGEKDTKPVRDVLPTLKVMAKTWQKKAHIILCRSLYRHNEFDVPGLEELCTEENRWGRDSDMDSRVFSHEFEKRHNSILETDDSEILRILKSVQFAVMTGMTVTSCIAKSKEAIHKLLPNLILVIPRDTTGVRASREQDAEALFTEWESSDQHNVIVTHSWRDMKFPTKS